MDNPKESTTYKTLRHIETVRNHINTVVKELLLRGEQHDQSKLFPPEVDLFDKHTPLLRGLTYGSPEYKESMKNLKAAIEHHNANNRHHPEFFHRVEIWKAIPKYEECYQISNLGNIKSLTKRIHRDKQGDFDKQELFMTPNLTPKGYLRIQLQKDTQYKHYFIHQLVAKVFIPNPNNYKYVNHKNGIKTDNSVENLEWVTASQNLLHAYKNLLRKPSVKYVVFCQELDITTLGFEKMEYELKQRNITHASAAGIYGAALGRTETHLDLHFRAYPLWAYHPLSDMSKMTLIDLIELLCDWKASCLRHNDGDIYKSIEINQERFGYDDELKSVLINTAKWLDSQQTTHHAEES